MQKSARTASGIKALAEGERAFEFDDRRSPISLSRPSPHVGNTLLFAQGVHPRLVVEILGHSQIAVTMNTYGHVILTVQMEITMRMDEAPA